MKVVGNLHAQVKQKRLAGRARSFHADDAARRALGHARDYIRLRANQKAGFGFAKAHVRPRVGTRNEARAVNGDVVSPPRMPAAAGCSQCAVCRYGFQIGILRKFSNATFANSNAVIRYFCSAPISVRLSYKGTPSTEGGLHGTSAILNLRQNRPRSPQSQRRVDSRNPVVRHDSQAAGEGFGSPRRERLPNIEDPKKYKAQQ